MNILIINGPNLNLLGVREPEIYGSATYEDLKVYLRNLSQTYNFACDIIQSNHEGKIIDWIQETLSQSYDAIVLNAGAYTHYSYAIRDAIASIKIPVIEVHLTDFKKRESFRQLSVITDVCQATFMGHHFESYRDAVLFLLQEAK